MADIGSGDEDLGERDAVVGQEVELEVVLRVRVRVDHARDVDDEADDLGEMSASSPTIRVRPTHQLRNPVPRRRLRREEHDARVDLLPFFRSHRFQG